MTTTQQSVPPQTMSAALAATNVPVAEVLSMTSDAIQTAGSVAGGAAAAAAAAAAANQNALAQYSLGQVDKEV